MQPYEVLSEDDTILFGAIPTSLENASDDLLELQQMLTCLMAGFDIMRKCFASNFHLKLRH